ncbi:TIGR04282 family arsenosugar biosynthesis glycosyltransferase [Marinobacterium sp. D7]|uniref:TIGR04282 family arsenosugar biosynthesis glycosyltransferase n=1 Tax=Marinobacterium ramblicola TaxID=2849041 RepID=UPI001C2D4A86|nr:TIGR04282 family arsenosugar biosynthesis glycosyltransferase [Marinobacterium ramblicola]MBV1790668.1 TIGR04282 family arsenosugar biosynthesis glycosyltransferase [Marinobacterium ramblicola]
MTTRIVILAKAPLPGLAKTRLIPVLGERGAAQLAERMLHHTLREACAADLGPVELCVTPDTDHPCWTSRPASVALSEQGGGDLGERMARIAARITAAGGPVLLIGTDCPALTADRLRRAAAALEQGDAVMTPAADGGYVLLGLNRFDLSLFRDIPWSTEQVAQLTRERTEALGWRLHELATLHDIDEAGDLVHLHDFPG